MCAQVGSNIKSTQEWFVRGESNNSRWKIFVLELKHSFSIDVMGSIPHTQKLKCILFEGNSRDDP